MRAGSYAVEATTNLCTTLTCNIFICIVYIESGFSIDVVEESLGCFSSRTLYIISLIL